MAQREDKDYFEKHFINFGNDYNLWLSTASDLFQASAVLKESYDEAYERPINSNAGDMIYENLAVHNPRLMLCAFSIECHLKALWLKQGKILAEKGEYVGPKYHDLEKLADELGIKDKFSPGEIHVLKVLTWFSFKGRFAISSNSKEEQKGYVWGIPEDDEIFTSILRKIGTEIDDLNKK